MNNISDNNFTLDIYGDSNNPHVIFFGGWGVSADSYKDRLQLLAEHFYIYGISLPGFGNNEPLDFRRNDIKGHAHFFSENVMPMLETPNRVVMMGHSTGAGVATLVANRHLDLVEKLVLVSPIGSPDPLNKSFIRMFNAINLKEALKYSTAEYWRRALPNMRLGVDAKYIDLTQPIANAIGGGVEVFIFVSEEDKIAPPGSMSTISGANVMWVTGGHAWFKTNPEDLLTSMIDIIKPKTDEAPPYYEDKLTLLESIVNLFKSFFKK
jgi:pimeloyl-ACP methyl ester carboxylesterase